MINVTNSARIDIDTILGSEFKTNAALQNQLVKCSLLALIYHKLILSLGYVRFPTKIILKSFLIKGKMTSIGLYYNNVISH